MKRVVIILGFCIVCISLGILAFRTIESKEPEDNDEPSPTIANSNELPYEWQLQRNPDRPTLSLNDIPSFELGMTVAEVHELMGFPHFIYGSGKAMDAYRLDDGRILVVDYGMYRTGVQYVFIQCEDGTPEVIIDVEHN